MIKRSRHSLFLMEQLIVVAVFAICAAACVSILTISYLNARDTNNLSRAVLAAESAAESLKALSGNLERTADILGGEVISTDGEDSLFIFYDGAWQSSSEADAEFFVRITPDANSYSVTITAMRLSVETINGEEILSFPVVARTLYGGGMG